MLARSLPPGCLEGFQGRAAAREVDAGRLQRHEHHPPLPCREDNSRTDDPQVPWLLLGLGSSEGLPCWSGADELTALRAVRAFDDGAALPAYTSQTRPDIVFGSEAALHALLCACSARDVVVQAPDRGSARLLAEPHVASMCWAWTGCALCTLGRPGKAFRLSLLTHGVQGPGAGCDPDAQAQALALGIGRTQFMEDRGRAGVLLDADCGGLRRLAALAAGLDLAHRCVAVRGHRTFAERLRRSTWGMAPGSTAATGELAGRASSATQPLRLGGRTVLVTGGCQGLGLALACQMSQAGAACLVLVSRTGRVDQDSLDLLQGRGGREGEGAWLGRERCLFQGGVEKGSRMHVVYHQTLPRLGTSSHHFPPS